MLPVSGQIQEIVEDIGAGGGERKTKEAKQRRRDRCDVEVMAGDHRQEKQDVLRPLMDAQSAHAAVQVDPRSGYYFRIRKGLHHAVGECVAAGNDEGLAGGAPDIEVDRRVTDIIVTFLAESGDEAVSLGFSREINAGFRAEHSG